MTTPAQNIKLSSYHVAHWTIHNQWEHYEGDTLLSVRYREYVRPKSISSPVRVDKTRRPTDYSSRSCRFREFGGSKTLGVDGPTTYTATGNVHNRGAEGLPGSKILDSLMRNTILAALAKGTKDSAQLNAALKEAGGVVESASRFTRKAARGLDNLGRSGYFKTEEWRRFQLGDYERRISRSSKRWAGPKQLWKGVPSAYLAYLYEIAPLGDDIANGLDTLSSYKLKGLDMSMILKAKKEVIEDDTILTQVAYGSGFANAQFDIVRNTTCKASFRFDIPSWYLDSAPTVSTFSTLWEITRLSFVLDWILPVGNWISSLESAQWSPFFKEGSTTSFIQEFSDLSSTRPYGPYNPLKSCSSRGIFERKSLVRSLVSEFPYTITKPPALNPFPGIRQFAQGLSLLTQAVRRWS